jgi:hypothetical protein
MYADGTALDGEMSAVKVGFRWLKQDGKKCFYVVGTQNEYDQFARDLLKEANQSSGSRGTTKATNRSGRHRRSPSTSSE